MHRTGRFKYLKWFIKMLKFGTVALNLWFQLLVERVSQTRFVGNKTKGQIWKQVFQENKARHIFRKMNISYPLICTRARAYLGVRSIRFSENLACFVFFKHLFGDLLFFLITDEFSPLLGVCLKYCLIISANLNELF